MACRTRITISRLARGVTSSSRQRCDPMLAGEQVTGRRNLGQTKSFRSLRAWLPVEPVGHPSMLRMHPKLRTLELGSHGLPCPRAFGVLHCAERHALWMYFQGPSRTLVDLSGTWLHLRFLTSFPRAVDCQRRQG